jgi:hypothetical protein
MTHAESQDLLLDLAYGELDAARAAEVEGHLSSCAECRAQKAALEETRRMAAPLRESEEPSPGFDARILQAARTQAQIEHDGSLGQVIEVTGTVRPLGVEAARIDAHGPVKARPTPRERPAWMKRAAIGGSLAAAAMLALVVGNTLETRRNAERVAAARSDDYQIRVGRLPESTVGSAVREATKPATAPAEPAPIPANNVAGGSSVSQGALARGDTPVSPPPRAAESSKDLRRRVAGSGGDAPAVEEQAARAKQQAAPLAKEKKSEEREQDRVVAMDGYAPDALDARPEAVPPVKAAAPHQAPARLPQSGPPPGGSVAVSSGTAQSSMPAQAPMASAQAERPATPASLEAGAQEARHAANYPKAASLYREAATLRRRENDPSAAAWNLAHAIECLAAVGRFDEARQVRDELVRLFPAETGPQSAARRVLREVEPPPAAH